MLEEVGDVVIAAIAACRQPQRRVVGQTHRFRAIGDPTQHHDRQKHFFLKQRVRGRGFGQCRRHEKSVLEFARSQLLTAAENASILGR
jgi:hypothetical protein